MAALAILVGVAWADDDSDRRDLIGKIDGKVEYAASELSSVAGDSDAGNINDSLGYVREVESLVSELSNKKGSDGKAGDIVSKYPEHIRNFRTAADYLIKLKNGQRLADGAADQCKNDEADLQTLIRNWVSDPDQYGQDAVTKLPEKGRAYGSKWSEKLTAWERHHREMANHASYARFSASDGKWPNVSSNFSNAASQISSHWMKSYEAVARACERLVKGEKHPDIEKAVSDLSSYKTNAKGTYKALEADYRVWLKDIQVLRQFTENDRDEMRKAMCFMGEYVMEQKIQEIADRWASQINSSYGTALGQADRLMRRTEEVKKRAPKSAPKLANAIQAVIKSLENLSQYELKGSNNPKIRAKLDYGKKAHDEKQGSCTYKELYVSSTYCRNTTRPGSGCKLDCVMVSNCMIYEIKPDSDGAKSEGNTQLADYKAALENWYAADKKTLFEKYGELQKCEKSGKLEFNTALNLYDFCPRSAAELGEKLDAINPDVNGDGD